MPDFSWAAVSLLGISVGETVRKPYEHEIGHATRSGMIIHNARFHVPLKKKS